MTCFFYFTDTHRRSQLSASMRWLIDLFYCPFKKGLSSKIRGGSNTFFAACLLNTGTCRSTRNSEKDGIIWGKDVSVSGVLWHREGVCTREQVNRCLLFSCNFLCLSSWNTHLYSLDRFAEALQPFLNSLHMVQNHIIPGKLSWPFIKEVVLETQPDYLKVCGSFVMHIWLKMSTFLE